MLRHFVGSIQGLIQGLIQIIQYSLPWFCVLQYYRGYMTIFMTANFTSYLEQIFKKKFWKKSLILLQKETSVSQMPEKEDEKISMT